MTATISSALWPHVHCCSHRRDSNSMPRLQVSLLTPTCALHIAYLLKRHLYDPGYVQLSQSRPHSPLLVPSMWEHIMHDQLLLAREVLVLLWREPTILLIHILVQGLTLFLNRVPSFFLWSTLVNPNLKGTVVLIQLTAILCIINFVFHSFNGIQAWRARTPPTLSQQPVGSSMRFFFKKPVIMFRTSSDQFIAYTVNTDLAILLNTDTFEPDLWCLPSRKTLQAKVRKVWSYSSFEAYCDDPHFLGHRLSHFAQYTFTMSWPRNVTLPLSYFRGFMGF